MWIQIVLEKSHNLSKDLQSRVHDILFDRESLVFCEHINLILAVTGSLTIRRATIGMFLWIPEYCKYVLRLAIWMKHRGFSIEGMIFLYNNARLHVTLLNQKKKRLENRCGRSVQIPILSLPFNSTLICLDSLKRHYTKNIFNLKKNLKSGSKMASRSI